MSFSNPVTGVKDRVVETLLATSCRQGWRPGNFCAAARKT